MHTLTNRPVPLIRRRIARPAGRPATALTPFWDCKLTRSETWLLAIVLGLALLLHLQPVLHSPIGVPMLYLLAIISYFSPATGFLFIACGQFIPFPETSVNNPAQVGVLVWLPATLLRYHRLRLDGLWRLWPVLPGWIWFMFLTGEKVFWPSSDYMKVLFYCMIACQLANEAKGKYLKCLFGLCLGALLIMMAYWAQKAGLPVEVNDYGGDRAGFERMGGVRADSVLVWPALLLGISGLLGIQIAFASKTAPGPSPKWLSNLTLGLALASLPALVSTMCNGAFAGLALVVCALGWAMWVTAKNGAMGNPRFRQLIHWCCAGVVVVMLMFVFDAFQIRTKTFALDRFHAEQSAELGGIAASRTGVWRDSIHTILSYPVFGIRVTGDQEEITSEYADKGGYLSHNVFLDYGRAVGIPGMLMVAFFFFYPVIRMAQTRRIAQYLPFILAHFAMFIFWMSLSFQFYKTFWALWMLMTITIADQSKEPTVVYANNASRRQSSQPKRWTGWRPADSPAKIYSRRPAPFRFFGRRK